MGLASALSTALTGLSAAETTIDVVGNNLANSNTVGFKASEATFATQFLQTQSLGSAATDTSGGTNPRQVGLGTMVSSIAPDFTQGTIEISSSATDLAIQGEGFFIVQGSTGEHLYTRTGSFSINADNELVTDSGARLLGYTVNDNYEIVTTELQPIEIPLGATAVAEATENVGLEGTLSPTGDVADTAEIIQSAILGDASWTAPDTDAAGTSVEISLIPTDSTLAATSTTGGGLDVAGTYSYVVVFGDGTLGSNYDTESLSSVEIGPIAMGGDDTITLTDIPVDTTASYSTRRIYRTDSSGTGDYYLVAEIPDNVTTTYVDTTADGALGDAMVTDALTGTYSYYVTFADAAGGAGVGNESRPSELIGPISVIDGRIQIDNLPVDASGQYSYMRLYRTVNGDENTFYFLDEINTATVTGSYTDSTSDNDIINNATLDMDGPKITASTLLTNVLSREGTVYSQVFEEGTLEFTARKGERSLETKEFTVDATTTVQDLINFMESAMGIQESPGDDSAHPIPLDSSGAAPGGTVTADGRIRFVGNNGTENAIAIGNSAMQLITDAGQQSANLAFSSMQSAIGESVSTDVVVYDSLGIAVDVRITMVLESQTSSQTVYRWFADSSGNDPLTGSSISVGTGLITFDGDGNYISDTNSTVSIDRAHVSSASPLEFQLDFSELSGLAADESSLAISSQDGSSAGVLTSYLIGEDGIVRGVFSNGITRDLGQILLARFSNPSGLEQRGENLYSTGVNSGLPVIGTPGTQGIGDVISGAIELSNTDIGTNLVDLILASTMYRGNARVITTSQEMLDELLAIRR